MTDKELDNLIRNWRRWCFGRDNGVPKIAPRAESLEGGYISPWPENDPVNKEPVDELSAQRVQTAIIQLGPSVRLVFLVAHFPRKAPEGYYFWPLKHQLPVYAKCQKWNYELLVRQSRKNLTEMLDSNPDFRVKTILTGVGIARA